MGKLTLNVGVSIPWAGGPRLNKKLKGLVFPSLCFLIVDMCAAVSDSCPDPFLTMMAKTKPSSLSFLLSEHE